MTVDFNSEYTITVWLSTLQSLGRRWISIRNWVLVNRSKRVKNWSVWPIITNPDKFDECDPDHILPLPSSDHKSLSEMNSTFGKAGSNALTLFHCNIRSLPKNLSLLHDILYCLDSRSNIIAISETRLNKNSVSNIELTHCNRWSWTLCLKNQSQSLIFNWM